MRKLIRLIMPVMIVAMVTATSVIPASAAYSYHSTYTFKSGKETFTAKVYKDPTWFCMFHKNASQTTGFEYKKNTDVVLSQTSSFKLEGQTITTLNGNVGFSGFGVTAGVGGSVSQSNLRSWGISNSSTRTIPSTAKKGYYAYCVCLNTCKIKVEKYKGSTKKGTLVFFAPRDKEPYRSIIYNTKSAYEGAARY